MGSNNLKFFQYQFKAMGTACDIQFFADAKDKAAYVRDKVVKNIFRLEARYSRYRSDSFLSKINRIAAKGGKIEVDEETSALLNYAATCHDQSEGLFDITSGILGRAWNFKEKKLPDSEKIQSLLNQVGWHKLKWKAPLLEFPFPGLEIDFGGIVKEYAVDRSAMLCRELGIRHGFVNLGGDISVIGLRPDNRPWQIGISHPRQPESIIQMIELDRNGLASSGDYERCIEIDGVRYGHVLNPKTGWPVRFMASVSVVSDLCMVAGSASTIAMLKEEQGPAWLEDLGLPHLWINVYGDVGGGLRTGGQNSLP